MEEYNQLQSQQWLFDKEGEKTGDAGPVTCLGITFPNDEERRKYYLDLLQEKLKDPEFRRIEGFPVGSDEDILSLSDPPYYTACPNPFIGDFIKHYGKPYNPETDNYQREPFAADVSEGKNDPIYNAHSYHTKVPHKAIMRYILHYTEPGDVVFDGFCGTGMTGVAAQLCGDKAVVESLGYMVDKDGAILQTEAGSNGKDTWKPFSKLGARRALLNDLSPAATFIAYNYNTPVDVRAFGREAMRILKEVEDECGWMYETLHVVPASKVEPASSRLFSSIDFEPCNPYEATGAVYRKDNLPHIQVAGATYFITFRTHRHRVLSDEAREIALKAALHWDNRRWKLFSAVVMPDHLHIVAKLLPKDKNGYWDLAEVLHSVKSFSANEINRAEKKTGAPVWQPESYDRVMRDADELMATLAYVNHNPVKAGLAGNAEEYPFRYMAEELVKAGWKPAPLGRINYTVWSDVFICPECTGEVVFWEAAVDKTAGKVLEEFPCPRCSAQLTKRRMDRAWVTRFDKAVNQPIRQAKQVPVLINYTIVEPASRVEPASSRLHRYEKPPDIFDLALIEKIEKSDIPYWFPTDRMPDGDESRRNDPIGITHVHHFYTKRNLWVLGAYCDRGSNRVLFLPSSLAVHINKMRRYQPVKQGGTPGLPGTLYVSAISVELSFFDGAPRKQRDIKKAFDGLLVESNIVTTQDDSSICMPSDVFDYIFTDPPFGGNLMYSELNFLWEAWLKVFTNNKPEAIENKVQGKGLLEYQKLMTRCFQEYFRVLKPGRWMTVEFHNSQNRTWNAIQESLQHAGFVIADVRTLDKKQGSFKQVTSANAVKQDLVISAYKPNGGLEERFNLAAGTEAGVWDFVRTHLRQLPVIVVKSGSSRLEAVSTSKEAGSTQDSGPTLEVIAERLNYLLYDRMVAFHVQRGVTIPISAAEFYAGLDQRFPERDGMYFLPEQAAVYDKKRLTVSEVHQLQVFVIGESSAIHWLKQQLVGKPQTFQEIHPQFMREIGGWQKYEKPLELSELLEQNFLCYDGKGEVPSQIHSYLSTNFKELRNLSKDDGILRAKARDRWYVPDPNKAGDLEKLREKTLLKEFDDYVALAVSQRKLKVFRLEAVRAGFKKAWQERKYATIISVASKIPENVLQEDQQLTMWYDSAITRSGEI